MKPLRGDPMDSIREQRDVLLEGLADIQWASMSGRATMDDIFKIASDAVSEAMDIGKRSPNNGAHD